MMLYSKDFVKWYHWGLCLSVVLCLQVDCSEILITSQPEAPNEGETVTLLFKYGKQINIVNWYRGKERNIQDNILTYNPSSPGSMTTGKQFNDRMKVVGNGSLQISRVYASDSGDYTLAISSPDTFVFDTYHLTVNSKTPPGTQSPPHLNPTGGQTKGGNNAIIIGVIIGSVTAVFLVLAASFIWYRRRGCYKSKDTPVSKNEKSESVSSPSKDISFEQHKNFNRRLPSIPPPPMVYENENANGEDEHPYTDLTYIYLSGSYHELQSP